MLQADVQCLPLASQAVTNGAPAKRQLDRRLACLWLTGGAVAQQWHCKLALSSMQTVVLCQSIKLVAICRPKAFSATPLPALLRPTTP